MIFSTAICMPKAQIASGFCLIGWNRAMRLSYLRYGKISQWIGFATNSTCRPPAASRSACLFRLTTSTSTPSLKWVWWLPSISGRKKIWRVTPAACANWIVSLTSWMAVCNTVTRVGEVFSKRATMSSTSSSADRHQHFLRRCEMNLPAYQLLTESPVRR